MSFFWFIKKIYESFTCSWWAKNYTCVLFIKKQNMVKQEQLNDLEKSVNKWIIRVIIWWVLVFEKFPEILNRGKKYLKEAYIHLMKQYEKFKKDFLK